MSYVARLSHYRDSLTCCSFKYKMYTALANKTFRVCGCPLWRDGGLCSQSPRLISGGSQTQEQEKNPTVTVRKCETSNSLSRSISSILASWLTQTGFGLFLLLTAADIKSPQSHQFCLPVILRSAICYNVSAVMRNTVGSVGVKRAKPRGLLETTRAVLVSNTSTLFMLCCTEGLNSVVRPFI